MASSSEADRVDWVVFGDDWGRHPSTTQHLVRALPAQDRVVWVGSLGMRAPRPTRADLARVLERARAAPSMRTNERVHVVSPRVIPLHHLRAPRRVNRVLLRAQVRSALAAQGLERPVVLVTAPVASFYLDALDAERVLYLRLDDHPRLPGVDAELAREAEARLLQRADACLATATTLALPGRGWHHLPQGVDVERFARTALTLPEGRVLGFFGALAPWLDARLIEAVARRLPDWTLELVGPRVAGGVELPSLPNVSVQPAVPYADLPNVLARWRATWIPFVDDPLTRGVDPLKARESLAAGLPTLATDLPALRALPAITTVRDADDVARALATILQDDSPTRRAERRRSVASESWAARAAVLRAIARGRTRRHDEPARGGSVASDEVGR